MFLKISVTAVLKDVVSFGTGWWLILGTNKNTARANKIPQLAAKGSFVTPKNCVIEEDIIGPTEYPIVPAAIKILMYFARFLPLYLTTNPVACGW